MFYHIKIYYNVYFYLFIAITILIFQNTLKAQINFEDISIPQGLMHTYIGGTGGGISFVDFDQDGLDDLTLAGSGSTLLSFYKNDGNQFIKLNPIIPYMNEVKQILWADYDNDGDLDLYISTYDVQNRLYRNEGFPSLIDVTLSAGLPTDSIRGHGALWFDANRDGWLDLYFTDRELPANQLKNKNSLYLNNQDGTFRDISESSGTEDLGKLPFCAGAFDYNNDLWPDLYVANDRANGNAFFKNNGDLSFMEVSNDNGTAIEMDAMTVTVGDINNDGYQDFYLTNLPEGGNKLLFNNGLNIVTGEFDFTESAELFGAEFNNMSWGANFLDVNLDGWQDLYVSGSTTDSKERRLLLNDGTGHFIQEDFGFKGDSLRSFCNAIGDINNDGMDEIAVINNFTNPFQLWQNTTPRSNNYIRIKLNGTLSNKNGVGGLIKVYTGALTQYKYTHCGTGFLAQNSFTQNIGVNLVDIIDSIEVIWPTGHIDKLYNIEVNQAIIIREGQSTDGNIQIDADIAHLYPSQDFHLFDEAQVALNIDHIHRHQNFLGGGAAIFDYDNDGDNDIYLTGGSDRDRLYINEGEQGFVDRSMEVGLLITQFYYTNGVIVGDVDNDGLKDIFVTTTGNVQEAYGKNLLFHQQADGTLVEKWLPSEPKDKTAALGASFIDYNQDGFLDIYVVSYVESAAFIFDDDNNIIAFDHECFENRLYLNTGTPESFVDVTDILSMPDNGCSLAVSTTDTNMDGRLDLLTANDFGEFILPSTLYEYDTLGKFTDVSIERNADLKMYGMGITAADYDHDLDMDYYITNIGKNVLMHNQLNVFMDVADEAGVLDEWIIEDSISAVSWGASFFDYDNDRYEDLFVADGYVPTPSFLNTTLWNPDRLYHNDHSGQFVEIDSSVSGINNTYTSRGSAVGDLDNDGDIDLISAVISVPQNLGTWQTKIYLNNLNNDNHWLQLDLEGIIANRDALGAKVFLYHGDEVLLKEIAGSSSHCSHDSDIVHFGLGDWEQIDSIAIEWPSRSQKQLLYDLTIDQKHWILEDTIGTSIPVDTMDMPDTTVFVIDINKEKIRAYPNPLNGTLLYLSKSNRAAQIVVLGVFNQYGQAISYMQEQTNESQNIILNSTPASGVFYLQYQYNDEVYIEKIVIINDD